LVEGGGIGALALHEEPSLLGQTLCVILDTYRCSLEFCFIFAKLDHELVHEKQCSLHWQGGPAVELLQHIWLNVLWHQTEWMSTQIQTLVIRLTIPLSNYIHTQTLRQTDKQTGACKDNVLQQRCADCT